MFPNNPPKDIMPGLSSNVEGYFGLASEETDKVFVGNFGSILSRASRK